MVLTLSQSLRKFADAESVLVRAVDILQRLSRSSTDSVLLSDTSTALFNLGNQYKRLKNLDGAEDCYRRAVGVLEKAFGHDSVEVSCYYCLCYVVIRVRHSVAIYG